MPTQVSAMLGSIVRSSEARALPCGVYGSYGWSGEAVDKLQSRLINAGFTMAFDPIKVQFRPDAKALQVCEESGTDLAQLVQKRQRKSRKQSNKRASESAMAPVEGADAAAISERGLVRVPRAVGVDTLCLIWAVAWSNAKKAKVEVLSDRRCRVS